MYILKQNEVKLRLRHSFCRRRRKKHLCESEIYHILRKKNKTTRIELLTQNASETFEIPQKLKTHVKTVQLH